MEVITNKPSGPGSRLLLDDERAQWLGCVFAAVHQVAWPRTSATADPATESMMRVLISYCYARGICRSLDIELAARNDPAVKYITCNRSIEVEEIRRFRRRNTETIKQVLGMLVSPAKAEEQMLRAIQADSADMDV